VLCVGGDVLVTTHFKPAAPRAAAEAVSISAGVAATPVRNEELLCSTSDGVAGMPFMYMAVVLSASGTLTGFDCSAGFGCPAFGGAGESAAAMGLDESTVKNKLAVTPAARAMTLLVCDMILLIP
jgi:hypothetical protein